MYMNAKRWRETKYRARAALRKPRGLPSERDDLKTEEKEMPCEIKKAMITSIYNSLQLRDT